MNNDSDCVKALVIDDEDAIRESFTDYLEDHGFEVLGAENGVIGLELAQCEQPGIILLDLRMPEMDGIEFLKQTRSILPDVPKVVISGANRISDVVRALRYGAWDYLEKPVKDLSILGHTVEKVIEKARLIRENRIYQEHLETLVRERTQELQQANNHLNQINERLRQIVKTTQGLSGCMAISHFGPQILEEFSRHMVATGGSLYLVDNGGLRRLHSLDTGHASDYIPFPLPDNSVLGRVMATGKPLLVDDITEAADVSPSGWTGYRNGSVLAFPLPDSNGETVGVLTLHSKQKPPFIEQDKEIGAILASYSCETFRAVQSFESLRKSEQQFRTLFEKSNDAIFIVEKTTGRYLDANNAAAELTGRSIDTIKTLSTRDITPDGAAKRLETVHSSDEACDLGQVTYIRPDSSERIARLSIVPLDERRAIGIARDVTHDLEVERKLRQSQKMEAIGTLAGGIAHDFNNILSGIFGYSQLAEMNIDNPERAKSDIRNIVKGASRATELVQQILTFSRKADYEKQYLNLFVIVKEVLKLIRSTIPVSIEIKEKICSKASIYADPIQMHQVIMNLCTNAYHAMGDSGGELTVRLDETYIPFPKNESMINDDQQYLELEISDTGHGMDENTMMKIFDPYFTTKSMGKGTGLGLALVRAIVEEHGGTIQVDSTVGKGTTFTIHLPVVEKKDKSHHKNASRKKIPVGKESILFVEDEESIRSVVKDILGKKGYQITLAENGLIAYENFKKDPDNFDMVITDMAMPKMNGLELSKKILDLRKTIPIILCTGFIGDKEADQINERGISFIQKPVAMTELGFMIRKILDHENN